MRSAIYYSTMLFSLLLMPLLLISCAAKAQPEPAFSWRSIYSPTNARSDVRSFYGTSHVDYDWDLWGHNLKKVVGDNPDKRVYATIADTLCRSQYCFSSEVLYKLITDYILDQYGEGTKNYSVRICIMPQDNRLACTCSRCRNAGNTEGNATPAVSAMLHRLANRFPRHQFFTSSYHSTRQAPQKALPKNVGVLVSAIDLPLRVDFSATEGCRRFKALVAEWKQKVSRIYVWDYARNYEDYLTPFPCLHALQSRFRLYRTLGIDGVFINGSGDEYSAFDDLQTVVTAMMMKNPDIDITEAVNLFFRDRYPVTASLLSDYYNKLEQRTVETNHVLPLYGTLQDMIDSYLNPKEFEDWRKELDKASKNAEKPERQRLNYLLTALSYTQLQLLHRPGVKPDWDFEADMRLVLQGHSELKGMEYYSEAYGKIDDYLRKLNEKE